MEGGCPRSGDGNLLCSAQLPGTPHALATDDLIGINSSVLFPFVWMPLTVGRAASVATIEAVLAREDKELVVVAQRDASVEAPGPQDFFSIGTKAVVKRMARRPDGSMELMVQGVERVVIIRIEQTEPYLRARVRLAPVPEESNTEIEAHQRAWTRRGCCIVTSRTNCRCSNSATKSIARRRVK